MKKMTREEIQHVLLEMMKDIHSFCTENNLRYSLAYGSLIGAVRHKGFIPWDDDIDIWMPRPDYEIFSSTYKNKNGYYLKSVHDKDCYTNFTRVYEVNKTYLVSPALPCKGKVGVWIDVLPIDGVSDDEDKRNHDYSEYCMIAERIMGMRGNLALIDYGTLKERIIHSIKFYMKTLFYSSLYNLHKKCQVIMKRYNFGDTMYCANISCLDAMKKKKLELLKTEDFMSYELAQFEDTYFYISSSYDRILSTIFGDYMKLPPENQRERHQAHLLYIKE